MDSSKLKTMLRYMRFRVLRNNVDEKALTEMGGALQSLLDVIVFAVFKIGSPIVT